MQMRLELFRAKEIPLTDIDWYQEISLKEQNSMELLKNYTFVPVESEYLDPYTDRALMAMVSTQCVAYAQVIDKDQVVMRLFDKYNMCADEGWDSLSNRKIFITREKTNVIYGIQGTTLIDNISIKEAPLLYICKKTPCAAFARDTICTSSVDYDENTADWPNPIKHSKGLTIVSPEDVNEIMKSAALKVYFHEMYSKYLYV